MNKLPLYLPTISQKISCTLLLTIFISCLSTMPVYAQSNLKLFGHWQLQKVSFKNMVAHATEQDKDLFLDIFKAALYEGLTEEQRLTLEDLEWMNAEAEILRDTYHQTTIEFQSSGAFYNTSLNKDKSLSGEYVLDKKKLLLEWETADKNEMKLVKITGDEFILEDNELGVTYYYIKPNN
ncbi:MAG: hypothetical protein Q8O62_12260 [Aequorivita sp.]|nr:hypothetical protein [Aequorivita sp.]